MATSALRRALSGECHSTNSMDRKSTVKRRVFVQTESGCVMGLELDRIDNAHTVKRRLQIALNMPTEECSLLYGDMVLKNDLNVIRNDSPLLLAKNSMHRSVSTPCLSPSGRDLQHKDHSGPIEILSFSDHSFESNLFIEEIVKAMKNGMEPIPVFRGLGGAYYLRNSGSENVAIVKPTDEEPYAPNNPKGFVGKALGQPGLKRSVRVGETGFREVAAYLLDHDHFAKVPFTVLVKITHSIFNVNNEVGSKKRRGTKQISKIASLQQYIPHDFDASDHGTSSFPVSAVHRIGILDVRILNTDRHAGNLLVRKIDGVARLPEVELIPIDHGLCLPECFEDPYFEWIHWQQASIPFSEDELHYIAHLDPVRDCEKLRMELPVIREACLRVLVVCTIFLKEAAAFGLCLSEIGEMMSREFRGHEERLSEFELVCMEARRMLDKRKAISDNAIAEEENEFQLDMDGEHESLEWTSKVDEKLATRTFWFGAEGGGGRNPLSMLEEGSDEDAEEEADVEGNDKTISAESHGGLEQMPSISTLSNSLKNAQIGVKSWQHDAKFQKNGCGVGTSSSNRSVNEQLSTSSSFVKFADMGEEQWNLFLDNFQKLLPPTLANWRTSRPGQRQRLGTSCRF
ncbi:hypothetical protein MLD38_024529 [Melastoma candidum]|uniref:Uncharacterized protein n=1 Tax=Melastoma candidum TaxID=119954 RepID=A0ACB9NSL2_9MYRT|nr:hypothetical protein MLD38_024529 [Melastoma candidum]